MSHFISSTDGGNYQPRDVHKNAHVLKSNTLVEARYRLTPNEQKFIYILCGVTSAKDKEFQYHRFNVSYLAKVLGMEAHNNIYSVIHDLVRRLRKRDLVLRLEDDSILDIGWLSSAKIHKGKGMVDVAFDPRLKPFLLDLKGKYTDMKLAMVLKFRSYYSMRIYELAKQVVTLKKRVFSLEDLKDILGIQEDEYQAYKNFKHRVLNTATREINELSDIRIELIEIKMGRKVTHLEFRVGKAPSESQPRTTFESIQSPTLPSAEPDSQEQETRQVLDDLLHEASPEQLQNWIDEVLENSPSLRRMAAGSHSVEETVHRIKPMLRNHIKKSLEN